MVKIVSGYSEKGGSTTAFINLTNFLNENNIDEYEKSKNNFHLQLRSLGLGSYLQLCSIQGGALDTQSTTILFLLKCMGTRVQRHMYDARTTCPNNILGRSSFCIGNCSNPCFGELSKTIK